MKRVFSIRTAGALCAVLLATAVACGSDNPTSGNPANTGSISGTVTFTGTINDWPATGNIQVSVWSYWPPAGPPDGFTQPLDKNLDFPTYDYKISGLDAGDYAMITVGWRDPGDPTGAKTIGEYIGSNPLVIEKGKDSSGFDMTADLTQAGP